jgi:hypothetical protein
MTAGSAFQYEALTDQQRVEIIDSRLAQYEAEHYSAQLNRMTLERATDIAEADKHQQLAQIARVLESLETSIAIHRDERARIADGHNGASS